jgi:hypothetical protein
VRRLPILACLLASAFSLTAHASGDATAQVDKLQSMYTQSDCIYFTLLGVSVADPSYPTSGEWYAMSRGSTAESQDRLKRAYAMLLAARLSGTTVRVRTTGNLVCNYPEVQDVFIW